ncbi:MAG: response regulator transcription factor [Chitinophagaceae bacterium]
MKPESNSTIKLAVVDDHTLFRQGLLKLIHMADRHSNYKVLFDAGGAEEMKGCIDKRELPDIILMDIEMPEGDGFEGVHWLKQYYPQVKVLVVSMIHTEEAMIRMLRLGVKGYLTKGIEAEDVYAAIDAISKGGYYYTDYITGHLLEIFQHEGQKFNGLSLTTHDFPGGNLNETERTFLKWVCTELTYMQIADKMNLNFKTIDDYREKLFKKLHVKTRVMLALYAVKHGLVKI